MAEKTLTPPPTKRPRRGAAAEAELEVADPEAGSPAVDDAPVTVAEAEDAVDATADEPNLFRRPAAASATTPLMQQYLELKERHEGDVLLFRMGDFYEMFYEDARTTAQVLGIVQTRRSPGPNAYAMAGFPHHALDRYLPRLIAAGLSVAIAEQVEDPALAKGKRIVRREVIEVITPGTLADESLLPAERANFLLALYVLNGAAALHIFLGAFFYAIVYTVWLKPRSIWNAVIGGAAGAAAPLIADAAVNVVGQHLQTRSEVGYVVVDVEMGGGRPDGDDQARALADMYRSWLEGTA